MVTFRNRAKSAPAALPMPIKQVNGHTRGEASPTTPRFPETSPATCRARAGCFSFPGQANRHVRHRRRTAEGGGGRFHHPAHRSRPRPNAGYMLPDLPGTTPDASWLFPLPGKRGSKQRHLPMQWEKGNPWPFRPGHPVQGVPSQAHCWHVPGAFPPPPFSPWCAAARPASPGARRRLGARVDQLPHDLARGGRKAQRRRDPGAKLNHVGHKTILSLAKVRKSAGVELTSCRRVWTTRCQKICETRSLPWKVFRSTAPRNLQRNELRHTVASPNTCSEPWPSLSCTSLWRSSSACCKHFHMRVPFSFSFRSKRSQPLRSQSLQCATPAWPEAPRRLELEALLQQFRKRPLPEKGRRRVRVDHVPHDLAHGWREID